MLLVLAGLASAETLMFTAADGRIGFHCVATLHEFDGRAGQFTGTFDPVAGRGRLVVVASSLSTGLGPRDSRMLYYALDAVQFPAIELKVERVGGEVDLLASRAGSGNLTLAGALTVRGVTRPVEVPARFTWEGAALRLAGSLPLDWTDYGIPDPSVVLSTLSPDLRVDFDVLARPPSLP